MKFFNSHISNEELADMADGRQQQSTETRQHLNACAHCTEELARLETAVGLMRRDDSAPAPAEAVQFARNIFRARQTQLQLQTKSLANRIAATLKVDLSGLTPAFGERSAAVVSNERQMLFAAGEYDVDLRLKKTENGFSVRGQVLGELPKNCSVYLEAVNFAAEAPVDETGFFSFSPLSSVDDLQVSLIFAE